MPPDAVEPGDTDPTARRLLRALLDVLESGTPTQRDSALHDAVRERARALRARGTGTQNAVADVRQHVAEAVRHAAAIRNDPSREAQLSAQSLLMRVEAWCIEECFRCPPS